MPTNEARPRRQAKPRYAKGVFIVTRERTRDAFYVSLSVLIALASVGIPAILGTMQGAFA